MLELLPISFTFTSLVKLFLIIGTNMFLGYTWYSPIGFQKQWMKATQWKEGDECSNIAILMSNIGAVLSAFLLHILLLAFDIRKHQFLSAILASTVLCGFYAFNGWNYVFFTKRNDYERHRTTYLIDIGYIFVLYTLISIILVGV